jgi:hypothetical protein
LNFSARHPPHAPCDPLELPRGLTGSDSFRRRGYPRNEFVHTGRVKTFTGRLLLPPPPARARGSVNATPSCDETTPNCKAQTSLLAAPAREGRGLLKLIKEDHFACATRMSEIFVASAPGLRPLLTTWIARATTVHRRARAHTLAASDYSLVKEQYITTPCGRRKFADHASFSLKPSLRPAKGGGMISLIPRLSSQRCCDTQLATRAAKRRSSGTATDPSRVAGKPSPTQRRDSIPIVPRLSTGDQLLIAADPSTLR